MKSGPTEKKRLVAFRTSDNQITAWIEEDIRWGKHSCGWRNLKKGFSSFLFRPNQYRVIRQRFKNGVWV